MELLAKIKILLGLNDNSKDNLINLLIEQATNEIKIITKREYTEEMQNLLIDMVVCKYHRIGNEGLASVSASGISESYIDGYPKHILRQLDSFIKRVHLL